MFFTRVNCDGGLKSMWLYSYKSWIEKMIFLALDSTIVVNVAQMIISAVSKTWIFENVHTNEFEKYILSIP